MSNTFNLGEEASKSKFVAALSAMMQQGTDVLSTLETARLDSLVEFDRRLQSINSRRVRAWRVDSVEQAVKFVVSDFTDLDQANTTATVRVDSAAVSLKERSVPSEATIKRKNFTTDRGTVEALNSDETILRVHTDDSSTPTGQFDIELVTPLVLSQLIVDIVPSPSSPKIIASSSPDGITFTDAKQIAINGYRVNIWLTSQETRFIRIQVIPSHPDDLNGSAFTFGITNFSAQSTDYNLRSELITKQIQFAPKSEIVVFEAVSDPDIQYFLAINDATQAIGPFVEVLPGDAIQLGMTVDDVVTTNPSLNGLLGYLPANVYFNTLSVQENGVELKVAPGLSQTDPLVTELTNEYVGTDTTSTGYVLSLVRADGDYSAVRDIAVSYVFGPALVNVQLKVRISTQDRATSAIFQGASLDEVISSNVPLSLPFPISPQVPAVFPPPIVPAGVDLSASPTWTPPSGSGGGSSSSSGSGGVILVPIPDPGPFPIPPPPPPPPPIIAVRITPTSASALVGNTVQFTAILTNSTQGVHWNVTGGIGIIGSSGIFTAVATGSGTIIATSIEDPTKTATATIVISAIVPPPPPPILVTLIPTSATPLVGNKVQFSAVASNSTMGVTWSVTGGVGSVSINGLFTASVLGSGTVVATSIEDPTKFDSSTIRVQAPPPPPPPPPGPTVDDMLDWCLMPLPDRLSFHMSGDGKTFEILDTDPGYPVGYPTSGVFWWVKTAAGHPWDVERFDNKYIYHWLTENADVVGGWNNIQGYKRMLIPVKFLPRMFTYGSVVTIDSPRPNYSHRTQDCESTFILGNLGDIRCVTTGPFVMNWGGDIGTQPTIQNDYYYGGSLATGVFTDLESTFFVKGFGRVSWKYYKLVNGVYTLFQKIINNNKVSGGVVPAFPCGLNKPWWI